MWESINNSYTQLDGAQNRRTDKYTDIYKMFISITYTCILSIYNYMIRHPLMLFLLYHSIVVCLAIRLALAKK